MKKILVLFLVFVTGMVLAENTIIAIVNNAPISLHSLKDNFLSSKTVEEKIEIAKQLSKLNVDVIEAGFPVSSKAQYQAVESIADMVKGPTIAALAQSFTAAAEAQTQPEPSTTVNETETQPEAAETPVSKPKRRRGGMFGNELTLDD